jgi:hypothetical protein
LQFPISLPVWNLLPKLRFLQFPWRWLVTLEAPMAIFFALAVSCVWPARRWGRVAVAAVCAAAFLGATTAAALSFFQPCDDEDAVASMVETYRSGVGVSGTDEYEPPGADDSLMATGLPAACLVPYPAYRLGKSTGEAETAPVWQADQGSCDQIFAASTVRVTNHAEFFETRGYTAHSGYLVLLLRSYPAWRIRLNGHAVSALPQRSDGLMVVPVPQGQFDLAVDWTTTADAMAGRWLSGLAFILLAALCLLERKVYKPRV